MSLFGPTEDVTGDWMMTATRLTPLADYLAEIGVTEIDLMADPRRPLVYQIGQTRYVDREDAKSWETSLTIQALYRRSGWPLEADAIATETEAA
jgi:hypothetical protein